MGVLQARAIIALPEDMEATILGKVNARLQEESLEIAKLVEADAKASTAFKDYTGTTRESEYHKKKYPHATRLRPNITAKASKFENGGAIVVARAPHAHLVELGHVLVIDGKVAGKVPAHRFLVPAAEAQVSSAIKRFADAVEKGLSE